MKMSYFKSSYGKTRQLLVNEILNVLQSQIRRLSCHDLIGQKLYFVSCCVLSFDRVCWKMVHDINRWISDLNPAPSNLLTSCISVWRRGKAVCHVVQFNMWGPEKEVVIIHTVSLSCIEHWKWLCCCVYIQYFLNMQQLWMWLHNLMDNADLILINVCEFSVLQMHIR
jgi:hypothetical protein